MEKIKSNKETKSHLAKDKYIDEDNFGAEIKKKICTEKGKTRFEEVKDILIEATQNMQKFLKDCKVNISQELLNDQNRYSCPKCLKMKKFYCPDCLVPVSHADNLPKVNLPLKLVIIHHESEKHGKSSALPLKILANDDTQIVRFPIDQMPKFDWDTTCILYPHKNAKRIDELDDEMVKKLKTVIAIDCTWYQTSGILRTIDNPKIIYIKLSDYETTFWRYQHHSKKCLATCEAIYYLYKEYDIYIKNIKNKDSIAYEYDGKYDNLLYYYILQHQIIQQQSSNSKKKIIFEEST